MQKFLFTLFVFPSFSFCLCTAANNFPSGDLFSILSFSHIANNSQSLNDR